MSEEQAPQNNQRDQVQLGCLIPNRLAGKIIGKAGATAKQLKQTHHVNLTCKPANGPDRRVHLTTNNIENLFPFMADMATLLMEEMQGIVGLQEGESEIRILIPDHKAGIIIGKGGQTVKDIRQQTGTKIKLNSNCCPNSNERVCIIGGSPDEISNCVREIMNRVNGPSRNSTGNEELIVYDANNFDLNQQYGGFTEDQGQNTGKGGNKQNGNPPSTPPPINYNNTPPRMQAPMPVAVGMQIPAFPLPIGTINPMDPSLIIEPPRGYRARTFLVPEPEMNQVPLQYAGGPIRNGTSPMANRKQPDYFRADRSR